MPCEHYKDALIEVAASGGAPQAALRAHLDGCASCRAAFDDEQSLFSAIDSGLHAAVNEEVPASLIPRVRTRLDEVAVAQPRWSSGRLAFAAAAGVAALLFLTVRVHHRNLDGLPTNSVSNRTAPQETIPTNQIQSLRNSREAGGLPRSPLVSASRSAPLPDDSVSRPLSSEVLVPHDQEVLLASYAQQWSSRPRAPLVANEVVGTSVEPLQVLPIQITNLDVKPLAEEGSR